MTAHRHRFYAGRSHRIIRTPDCLLQPVWMNELAARACALLEEYGVEPYNEETGKGRVRHLYMRQGWHSGQRLLCFVVNGNGLPHEAEICAALQKEFDLTTVLVNRNTARTNVILGQRHPHSPGTRRHRGYPGRGTAAHGRA